MAGLWAIAVAVWWTMSLAGLVAVALTPQWHAHALISGVAGAAVGGFLLTAAPAWSGRRAVRGRWLGLVCLAWVGGRFALFVPEIGLPLALAYPVLVAFGLIVQRVWMKNVRRVGFVLIPVALGVADVLFLLSMTGTLPLDPSVLLRTSLLALALVITIIGGRMITAFARAAGERAGMGKVVGPLTGPLDAFVLGALLVGMVLGGGALIAAGVLAAGRMMQWPRVGEGPVLALYAAWAWLPIGLVLIGLADVWPQLLAASDALHALAVGAMGCMIVAVAGRASLPRDGARLRATLPFVFAVAAIWAAAALRLVAALTPHADFVLLLSGGMWVAGWSAFLWSHVRAFSCPLPRPVFSGVRPPQAVPPSAAAR